MKYLYTVLDRKKVGNSSVYLVRNLKTKEEKVMPIDWIRKQYPKGVFSNISISETGKINIVKDKTEVDILSKMLKTVSILEFYEDAKLDGLPFKAKDGYAIKEIEVLKEKFITLDLMKCVKLTEESFEFLNETEKGEILTENVLVERYADYSKSDYVGERYAEEPYPEAMNEDTSIFYEVDVKELKLFLSKKRLNLNTKELQRLIKAIIYSLLYYYHDDIEGQLYNLEKIISKFENMKYEYSFGGVDKEDEKVFLRNRDIINLSDDLSDIICLSFLEYVELVSEYVEVLYLGRVVKKKNNYYFEIYAHSGYFDMEGCVSSMYDDYMREEEEREEYYASNYEHPWERDDDY